jgi:hypothetical protein
VKSMTGLLSAGRLDRGPTAHVSTAAADRRTDDKPATVP